MTTRVVGRGRCPKCGEEGSVVLKDIYNKVYVYVKHGRKWCYLGPLEVVDLSSIVISLSDYHYFTTKINEYASRFLGLRSMRISALVFASIFSVVVAYTASASMGYPYEVKVLTALISQFSVVVAVFTTILAIVLYEVKYKRRFEIKIPYVTGNPVLGLLFTILAVYAAIVVFSPLRSHLEDYVVSIPTEVRDSIVVRDIVVRFSLPCVLLSSLVLAVLSKGLFSKLRWSALALLASPFIAVLAQLCTSLALAGQLNPATTAYLWYPTRLVGSLIASLGVLYFASILLFKKILQLEQVQQG